MLQKFIPILLAVPFVWACGASMPEPKQPLADAESASRSARELGADAQPAAKLYARLANEQIGDAKALIAQDEHERATYVLVRARADAELAVALAREQNALVAKKKAVDESSTTLTANVKGAQL